MPLKIAQIAPLNESVPPKLYGGTERVVYHLTEELVRLGHDVTLFATGDSATSARLVPCRKEAIRLDESCQDKLANTVAMVERAVRMADEFDILHFHIDYIHLPIVRRIHVPHVTTLHGRQDHPELVELYQEFIDAPLVSISNDQRRPIEWCNWAGTVHHGLPLNLFRFTRTPDDYVAFLGRFSREKGVEEALDIAKRLRMKLRIAAKVDEAHPEYYRDVLRPMINNPWVEYVGEIRDKDKAEFLGNARVLLFPINWPEPFGLVMIEAMACGTPVVAFRRGSVPEVVEPGVTGFVVETVDEAVAAARRAFALDRRKVRAAFERRFDSARMAAEYVRIYEKLIAGAAVTSHGRRYSA